jgi:hypothetical protein
MRAWITVNANYGPTSRSAKPVDAPLATRRTNPSKYLPSMALLLGDELVIGGHI